MPPQTDTERQRDLNAARVETRNLAEMLSIDFAAILSTLGVTISAELKVRIAATPFVKRMQMASRLVAEHGGFERLQELAQHPSDTVRGMAAYIIAWHPQTRSVACLLQTIKPIAEDHHFAVREWAWMAARPRLADHLPVAILELSSWVNDANPNMRRFAVEALRPRGVWTQHLQAFRADPTPILPLLAPLQRETNRYVQDSVANWLNDAGKDNPAFVREICQTWLAANPDDASTARICRRAQRRLQPR